MLHALVLERHASDVDARIFIAKKRTEEAAAISMLWPFMVVRTVIFSVGMVGWLQWMGVIYS